MAKIGDFRDPKRAKKGPFSSHFVRENPLFWAPTKTPKSGKTPIFPRENPRKNGQIGFFGGPHPEPEIGAFWPFSGSGIRRFLALFGSPKSALFGPSEVRKYPFFDPFWTPEMTKWGRWSDEIVSTRGYFTLRTTLPRA